MQTLSNIFGILAIIFYAIMFAAIFTTAATFVLLTAVGGGCLFTALFLYYADKAEKKRGYNRHYLN